MSKKNISGIYAIKNKLDNKIYVGSSKSVYYRWKQQHYVELKGNTHGNRHLQNAWNKYGEDNFEFIVLEECDRSILFEREEYWMEHFKSWMREYGYNLTRIKDLKTIIEGRSKNIELDEKILTLFNSGFSKRKIANELNVGRGAIYSCLERNGLHKVDKSKGNKKLTDEVKQQIVELREQGLSWDDISKETGISRTQMHRVIGFKDGKFNGKLRNSYRTLTPEIKEKAIEMRAAGNKWKDIGEALGVSMYVFYSHGLAHEQPNMVRKKVTPEVIEEAKRLKEEGLTNKEIGQRLNYSYGSIQRYLGVK